MSTKQIKLLLLLLVLILIFSSGEVVEEVHEYQEGTSLAHILSEFAALFLSLGGIFYLIFTLWKQLHELAHLKNDYARIKSQLSVTDSRLKQVKQEFNDAVEYQFSTWALTPSEVEVARLMIKGLSFREIAELRSTQEKTVRQQAANVYAKSGLGGRHEFAAYFFEDLM